jgi:hypothetical protein
MGEGGRRPGEGMSLAGVRSGVKHYFSGVCGQLGTAPDGEDANGSPETAGIFSTASLARRKFEAVKTSELTTALQAEQNLSG